MALLLYLEMDAEPMNLGLVRHAVQTCLASVAWPLPSMESIVFSISEAVSNSIEHAYCGWDVGRVRIEMVLDPADPNRRRIVVVVADDGQWRPEISHSRGNGLGLVAAMTDTVAIATDDAGTQVTITCTADART